MIIEKFHKREGEARSYGLSELTMGRLGRLVAIAGKNGAGKTRLFNLLEHSANMRSKHLSTAQAQRGSLENLRKTFVEIEGSLVSPYKGQVEQLESMLHGSTAGITARDESSLFACFRFVPKYLNLEDSRAATKHQISERFQAAKNPGALDGFHSYCLYYIEQIQARHWNVTHQGYTGAIDEKDEIINDYDRLVEIVRELFGAKLTRSVDGDALLFGKPIFDAGLSDGQKVLLQFAVGIHARAGSLENTVFILDEPENHLHPAAVVDVVKALYEAAPSSQIWVATHSVPLLAYMSSVDPMCLWFMDDGKISNAGRRPELVLESLLGNEEGIAQLGTFTNLPAELASVRYATESLLPPQVLAGGAGDPQVSQIQQALERVGRNGRPLALLDYGAGKGRLLEGLADLLSERGIAISDAIDYFAFDVFEDDHLHCAKVVAEYYGKSQRIFHKEDAFFSLKDAESIDVVVMTNVLHEIPPRLWPGIFSAESIIYRCLRSDGYLLVVEDQRIPVGEKAHEHGFLVLDTVHLKTLFAGTESDVHSGRFIVDDARNDGRLKAHLISRALLNNVTDATVKRAIEQLRRTSHQEIQAVRTKDPSYKNGQLHGFWTQQFANASLFLEP